MSKLERMLDTLNHKVPGIVPSNIEFADPNAQRKFVPMFNPRDWRRNEMEYLGFLDSYIVEAGHGELLCKIVERGEGYHIVEFESGVRWRIRETHPWSRQYFNYPIPSEEDLKKMILPDADDPRRYEGTSKDDGREIRENGRYSDENDLARFVSVGERVDFFRSQGIFTIANINGFFSGIWYFWRPFKSFLLDLYMREDFAEEMIKRMAEYNLRSAKNLLGRGVHSIHFCDDLGSSETLFISPKMYEKYFYPWHKKLADLCHHYGAYAYMHSHGNINKIVPLIVKAGIDILNPVGPGDKMNLEELKQKYGDKITFCGGISKYIGDMTKKELESHIKQVLKVGSPGGGFIPREEGGVPYAMSVENFKFYIQTLKKYRYMYGSIFT